MRCDGEDFPSPRLLPEKEVCPVDQGQLFPNPKDNKGLSSFLIIVFVGRQRLTLWVSLRVRLGGKSKRRPPGGLCGAEANKFMAFKDEYALYYLM